jgi:hypothetical protein
VLKQIGSGSYGRVYKVKLLDRGGAVAVLKQVDLKGLTPVQVREAVDECTVMSQGVAAVDAAAAVQRR